MSGDDPRDERNGIERLEAGSLFGAGASLADALDTLLDKGVAATGQITLGLADIDLIHLQLAAVLGAADRLLPSPGGRSPSGSRPGDSAGPTKDRLEGEGDGRSGERRKGATAAAASDLDARGTASVAEPSSAAHERAAQGTSAAPAPSSLADPLAARSSKEPPSRDEAASAFRTADLDTAGAQVMARTPTSPPASRDDPEEVRRSVARLVLSVVELLRRLMEHQAIRRMEEETLNEGEIERLGQALQILEETLHDLAARFDLSPDELNLDLGPLGRLV
jgi:hypothetical protein